MHSLEVGFKSMLVAVIVLAIYTPAILIGAHRWHGWKGGLLGFAIAYFIPIFGYLYLLLTIGFPPAATSPIDRSSWDSLL